jgi:hypothetical protein
MSAKGFSALKVTDRFAFGILGALALWGLAALFYFGPKINASVGLPCSVSIVAGELKFEGGGEAYFVLKGSHRAFIAYQGSKGANRSWEKVKSLPNDTHLLAEFCSSTMVRLRHGAETILEVQQSSLSATSQAMAWLSILLVLVGLRVLWVTSK